MTAAGPDPIATAAPTGIAVLVQRRGVRQFAKFCIVGAGSTLIDFAVFSLVYYGLAVVPAVLHTHRLPEIPWLPAWLHSALASDLAWQEFVDRHEIAVLLAATISFVLAVSNGFYWNRKWTFAHARGVSARRQYAQFVLVNIVGLGLNLTIIRLSIGLFRSVAASLAPLLAKAVATGVVVFWNFLANKYWTFADRADAREE